MKKTTWRVLALMLVMAMAFSVMAGCSAKEETATEAAATEETTTDEAAITCKIGVVNTGTAESMAWTRAHKEGIDVLQETYPDLEIIWVEDVADSGTDCGTVIDSLVEEGCNLIFTTSYGFATSTQEAAEKYPDVLFYHNQSNDYGANFGVYDVRDYEAVFLTGYLAARVSEADYMGYVGTYPMPTVIRATNAFALGAQYANEDVKMQAVYTNSWYDVTAEKEAAVALIDNGVGALGMQVSSTAVVQAGEENGVVSIGFSDDMYEYAPNSVLCSFQWNWGPMYVDMVERFMSGEMTEGEDLFYGLDYGCGGITDYNTDLVSQEIIDDCEELYGKLQSGEVKVFYGEMTDNTGETHGVAGEEMSYDEIRSMDWLVDFMEGTVS